jgi:hypothetical protein
MCDAAQVAVQPAVQWGGTTSQYNRTTQHSTPMLLIQEWRLHAAHIWARKCGCCMTLGYVPAGATSKCLNSIRHATGELQQCPAHMLMTLGAARYDVMKSAQSSAGAMRSAES